MVQTGYCRIVPCRAYRVRRHVGQQVGTGGGAYLVVDDRKRVAFLRQPQHGFGKIAAARAIDPAGAENEMPASGLPDELLTLQLGAPVHTERPGGVGLAPRLVAAAVEHIVGGVVDQPGIAVSGFLRQYAGSQRIDGARAFCFVFGLVHGGVSPGIDDDVRLMPPDAITQAVEVLQVCLLPPKSDQFAQRRQRTLQFPADLAILA
jgi:hypothetical protein